MMCQAVRATPSVHWPGASQVKQASSPAKSHCPPAPPFSLVPPWQCVCHHDYGPCHLHGHSAILVLFLSAAGRGGSWSGAPLLPDSSSFCHLGPHSREGKGVEEEDGTLSSSWGTRVQPVLISSLTSQETAAFYGISESCSSPSRPCVCGPSGGKGGDHCRHQQLVSMLRLAEPHLGALQNWDPLAQSFK